MDAPTLIAREANADAARALLPWATAWCPVGVGMVIAFVSSGLATWIAQRIALAELLAAALVVGRDAELEEGQSERDRT